MMSYEQWVRQLLEGTAMIADAETQSRRWVASDAAAWERPVELLCVILDDLNLQVFIEQHRSRFSKVQLRAATDLAQATLKYDCGPTGWRDSIDVLRDPAWEDVRERARAFMLAFDLNEHRIREDS